MAVTNSLVKKEGTSLETMPMSGFLTQGAIKTRINQMIGEKDGLRFIASLTSSYNTNVALKECTNTSVFNAALLGESLKLSPSPQLGHFYMIPFENKNKKVTEAQFILGYKGYIQLALRSGFYKKINVLAIKETELVYFDPLNEEIKVQLISDDTIREKTPTMGYYAMFEYINGFRKAIYWSKDKMINHADKYSKAFNKEAKKGKTPNYDKVSYADYEAGNIPKGTEWLYSSFWYQNFDEMAHKTMLKHILSRWGILSIEMQKAFQADNAVIEENEKYNYVDSPENEIKEIPTQPEEPEKEIVIEVEKDDPLNNFE